jgi:hypothetical protein
MVVLYDINLKHNMKKILLSILFAHISTLGFSQAPSYVPANGLVGWWPFNGNANDESGNGNNGIVNGATLTTDRNGLTNSSFTFNVNNWSPGGSGGDKIYIPYNPSFNFSDFTISTWVKRTTYPAGGIINRFQYGYNNTNGETWILELSDSILYGTVIEQSPSPAQSFYSQSNQTVLSNQWCNIIMTYSQNTINLYINNQLVGTSSDPSITINTVGNSGITIGLCEQANGQWQPFDGSIDDIGIWNRALTQQEITNLYTSTVPVSCLPAYVPTSGLVGYWPFCGNANDESGNGNNGTVNGATLTIDRNGNVNGAYSFDGVSNFIQLNSILISGNQSRSISFFYKISNNPITDYSAISFGGNSTNCSQAGGDYEIGFFNNNGISTRADGTCSAVYASSINDSEWHHVVFNYDLIDGSTFESINIYIDGAYIAAANYNGSTSINTLTLSSLVFGKSNKEVRFFNGKLDDIGIWNRALTDCEIQNLYTSQLNSTFVSAGADQTICDGQQVTLSASNSQNYSWNNGVIDNISFSPTSTQDYIVTADSANCQSSDTVTIFVNESTSSTQFETSCDSYTWNGQTYTASGVYIGTTTDCVTQSLNLTITPSSTNTTTATACDSYLWNGTNYTSSGVYTGTTTNCIAESLNLTITPSSTNTTTASACNSYVWNGTTYTESGVYTGTTANCITESLDLTITPSSTNTTTASACDSYVWNGTTYTASAVYTGTTTNCVTESLNLTITPSSTNTTASLACNSYVWNGTTYTESGVYTGTTANCVTESLNLTITPNSTNTTTVAACNSYTWNGQAYTQSGVYTGTTANCVTQALNLTINTNTSSSISQTALDTYTWPVNNQTYTTTGAYTAVIPNASGCDSTITLNLTMSFTGINDLSASKLTIYPNPTNGDFTITGLELVGTVSSLSLTDMNGKVVKVLDPKATKFSMASIKPGVYFLNIISGIKQEVLKIVKE